MCAYVFSVYICLYIFLYQLSFFPLYKAWELDWFLFVTGFFLPQSHFPVCPAFSCIILGASSCVSQPQALSFTALQSALSPAPPSHLFPLKMCLIANPSPWIFFFFFSIRLRSFFNIRFITFPAVVFLSLFFRHFLCLLGFPSQHNTGFSFLYVILLSFRWATIAFPNMASVINGTKWIKLLPASKLKHFKTELLFFFFVQHLICTSVTLWNYYYAYAMLPSSILNSVTISDHLSNVRWFFFVQHAPKLFIGQCKAWTTMSICITVSISEHRITSS